MIGLPKCFPPIHWLELSSHGKLRFSIGLRKTYSSPVTLRLNLHHNFSDQCLFFLGFLLLTHISPLHTSLPTFFLLEDGCGWCRGCHPAKLLYCRSGVWALPQAFNPSFPQAKNKKYRASGRNRHWKLITINTPTIFMLLLFSSILIFFYYSQDSWGYSVLSREVQNFEQSFTSQIFINAIYTMMV